MKKDKNSLKQKIVIAIACLVIVACTISMTTMAWFTDTMQGTTNLTFGKIKLSDDYTEYTFNTPEAPAVASRKINDGDWTIVLDETSNDAFIRLIAKYGAPISYTETSDSTYLENKAYYYFDDRNYTRLVVETDYDIGDPVAECEYGTVYECNYSLDYIINTVSTSENVTLAKISSEKYTTQYHAVSVDVLGNTFLKGVKYYAFVGGQFRALIGSTTYDANTDYYYGQSFADTDIATITTTIEDTVVTAVSGLYVEYNYSKDGGRPFTHKIVPVADTSYSQLIETNDSANIHIDDNSTIGTTTNATSEEMYCNTIYNAYIDWLIENVAIPETPEAVGHYYTEVDTTGETPVGKESTKGDYAFIRSTGTNQGTAEYYLASDLLGTALNAVRTDEDGITYNFTFAEDGDIKIKDSADQITLKSATLTAIADSTALAAARNNDATKVLKLVDATHHLYVIDNNEGGEYAADTYYTYTGDVTVINGHAYFFEVAANATPLVLKYAQKDLGLGLSIDIQAIQTILSRKAGSDDANLYGASSVEVGDKLTIAIMTVADSHVVTGDTTDDSLAGELGAYLNGTIKRVATIADIAPYFKAQFDRPAN